MWPPQPPHPPLLLIPVLRVMWIKSVLMISLCYQATPVKCVYVSENKFYHTIPQCITLIILWGFAELFPLLLCWENVQRYFVMINKTKVYTKQRCFFIIKRFAIHRYVYCVALNNQELSFFKCTDPCQ